MKVTRNPHAAVVITVPTNIKKKSFTFLEIIVAALLLSIAVVGLLSSFLSVRGLIARSQKRLISFDTAKQGLASLYVAVNASSWDTGPNPLEDGDTGSGSETLQYPSHNYGWSYQVSKPGGHDYRVVKFNVTIPDN